MISEPTIVDWQAFMLVGLPDQSVERGLNCFCEQLDSELTDEIPDGNNAPAPLFRRRKQSAPAWANFSRAALGAPECYKLHRPNLVAVTAGRRVTIVTAAGHALPRGC